jgi:superfamily II DNA or RNA helicase
MIRMRDYQSEAVAAVETAWLAGVERPAVVLPTGTGKTVVFAHLADKAATHGRVLVLAHRDELVQQAAAKLRSVTGGRVGVVQAGSDETDAPVVVASVQTLAGERRRSRLTDVATIICDEAHHATAPTYRKIMEHYACRAVGFTATMARGDGGRLGDVWQKIVYQRDIVTMIRAGHLADVRGIRVQVPDLDLSQVTTRGGDYAEGELGSALADSLAPEVVAKAYLEHADGMPGILFAPTVATARLFGQALSDSGVRTGVITGEMPSTERRALLADFEAGRLDMLSNCMVLTEGFDSPRAQVAILARPTASAPLYVQMVGRVLRPYPGKRQALVLDVVGASGRHELATLAVLSGSRPVKPRDGQSFLEALDAAETATERATPEGWTGPVEAADVDLFAGSRQAWLQTRAGYWVIPAGERYICLAQLPDGTYDVAWYGRQRGGGWISRSVPDIGYAMAWGEGDITDAEQLYAAKERGWRKRPATVKAINYARALGIEVPDRARGGQVGDLLTVELASRRIDKPLTKYLEAL